MADGPPVRYYPRRVSRAGHRPLLSPSQALHLASDPRRAAAASATDEHHIYDHAVTAPAENNPAPGRLRRWWTRFLGR